MTLDELRKEGVVAGKRRGFRRTVIDPALKLPAGYYRLPGVEGAQYYDPRSGQVTQEFADWANSGKIERDDLTGAPKAFLPGEDAGDVFRAQESQSGRVAKTLDDIFAMGKTGGSYQESQDRALGLGRYQQFLTDRGGKQMRVLDALGQPPIDSMTAPYVDRSEAAPTAGAFERLLKLTGKSPGDMDVVMGVGGAKKKTGEFADYWKDMRDALAKNYETGALGQQGLREQRVARGLDPETGTSEAERKRIYETVSRITDPTQRAAYIHAQDPGNLTPELRAERYAARAGEREQVAGYERAHPTVEYNATGKYGQPAGMQVKLTSGGASFTDTATGRESFIGQVPKTIEMVKPYGGKDIDKAARAAGGGVMGAMVGFATGGIPGAFLGAYAGAGGPLPNPRNISFKNTKGWGEWRSSGPHMMDLKEIGTAFAFARFTGSGVYNQKTAGAAANLRSADRGYVVGR